MTCTFATPPATCRLTSFSACAVNGFGRDPATRRLRDRAAERFQRDAVGTDIIHEQTAATRGHLDGPSASQVKRGTGIRRKALVRLDPRSSLRHRSFLHVGTDSCLPFSSTCCNSLPSTPSRLDWLPSPAPKCQIATRSHGDAFRRRQRVPTGVGRGKRQVSARSDVDRSLATVGAQVQIGAQIPTRGQRDRADRR